MRAGTACTSQPPLLQRASCVQLGQATRTQLQPQLMHAFVLLAHFCHLGHVKRVFVATLVLGITHLQNVLDRTISRILERARVLHAQPAAATMVLANSSLIVANAPMGLC